MDANTLFKQFSNFIVEQCEFDAARNEIKMVIKHPEEDVKHEAVFEQVTFCSYLIDEKTHRLQEEEDLPRAFLSVEEEEDSLQITRQKQEWLKDIELVFNTRIVFSDGMMLVNTKQIKVDDMLVEEYPEIEEEPEEGKGLFYGDEELEEMEENGQWEESISYLREKWEHNKRKRNVLFRYATQIWYALTFKEKCGIESKDTRAELKSMLKEVAGFAKQNFAEDTDYLWIFGYMMEANPFAFVSVITYTDEIKLNGKKLINEAANAQPESLLAQVVSLSDEKKMTYKKKKKQLKPYLLEYFPGEYAVDKYFLEFFE